MVNNFSFCGTCSLRRAESPKLTSVRLDEARAAEAKVGLALPACRGVFTVDQPAPEPCETCLLPAFGHLQIKSRS